MTVFGIVVSFRRPAVRVPLTWSDRAVARNSSV
jgi:hypothetical protein